MFKNSHKNDEKLKQLLNDIAIESILEDSQDNHFLNKVVSNREYLKELISIDGMILKKLPSHYRNDREIVRLAVRQNRDCIQFADKNLVNDVHFLSEILGV